MRRPSAFKKQGVGPMVPGTYGDASNIPVITVDGLGNIIAMNIIAAATGATLNDFKESVRAATTANITLSGAQTIDGVSVIAGDRVLVKDQSTGANNGIYVCAAGSWTRATDFDASGEVTGGCLIPVTEGTANGDKFFMLTTNDPITLGSTSLAFAAFTTSAAAAWSALTDPAGNLSLAMAAFLTTLTWAGNFGSSSAFKLAGNNTSATGPLLHLLTAISNNIPPLLVEPRTGQALKVDHLGNVYVGKSGGMNASDTDGFLHIPFIASSGEPTSNPPTTATGFAPIVLENDAINGEFRLWAYESSGWKCLTPSGGLWIATSGSGAKTIDWTTKGESCTRQHTAGSGNNTFTFTAPPQGTICNLIFIQDAVGGRTITWPASVKWPGGSVLTPDTGANAKTVWQFVYDGTNYLALGYSAAVS